jgi:outer membrane biosynthesis protein TonB
VTAHGYAPGEEVTIRTTTSNGTVLATAKADGNGTVTTEVTIPASDGAATVDLIVVGADGVLLGKGTFNLTAAVEGTPTATEEPNVTEPPATPAPVEAEEPVSTPTEVPTEEPVDQPTEVPVEEPTEVPTEEPVPSPTPEPAEEPTVAPTGESTEEPLDDPADEPTIAPLEGQG